MKITIINSVSEESFIKLYKDAGWWSESYENDKSFINNIVKNSFLFVAAFDDADQMIGMGRALSDGCSDGYIQDVVVLKGFRNRGIGQDIIKFLIKHLKNSGVDWIGLIGEPNTKLFYKHLGFKELKEHTPMILTT